MGLCTLAQVRQQLGHVSGDTEHDALITATIARVSARLPKVGGFVIDGRPVLEKTDADIVVHYTVDPGIKTIYLPRPVVAVTEIKEALFGEFAAAGALVENTDYQLNKPRGRLARIGYWMSGEQAVRVTLTAGYTRCDRWVSGTSYTAGDVAYYGVSVYTASGTVSGSTPPPDDTDNWTLAAGQVPMPEDITHAAILQVAYWFMARDSLGLSGAGGSGGSMSKQLDQLLPEVAAIMNSYRRMIGQ